MRVRSIHIFCLILLSNASFGQVPQLINYQGRLMSGTNLVNGDVELSLRVFKQASGGSLIYEDSNTVTVVDGLYSTFLGDNSTTGTLDDFLTGGLDLYIEVAVNGVILAPREQMGSATFALMSGNVLDGAITSGKIATGAITSAHLANNAVTTAKIASNAVTTAKLGDGAVSGTKIASNTITTLNVADGGLLAQDFASIGRLAQPLFVTNPAPASSDYFGQSVAGVESNRFVVGAFFDSDSAGGGFAGTAYLYDPNGVLLVTITNPTPASFDLFGCAVAGIGSNRFVIGAYSDDAGAADAGSAYLYNLNGVLLVTITNPAPLAGDGFGISIAAVGSNRFVVGAWQDDAGATNAGSAYLYDLNGILVATITNPAPAVDDIFAWTVAGVGSNRFVVGAPQDDAGTTNAGSAYLYDVNGVQLATITNPAPAVNDQFGVSVAGVGSNLFVVGGNQDDAGATNAGSAYLYDANGTLVATIPNPAPVSGDAFGSWVAGVGDTRFMVGAFADDAGATNAGSAYLYDLNGTLVVTIPNPAPAIGDEFGNAAADVGSNKIVIAASFDDAGAGDAGSAYLYDLATQIPVVTGLVAESAAPGAITTDMLDNDLRLLAPFAQIVATGTTTLATFNAVNCTAARLGTGSYRVTFTAPPATAFYSPFILPQANVARFATITNRTTALFEFNIYDAAGAAADAGFSATVFGGF